MLSAQQRRTALRLLPSPKSQRGLFKIHQLADEASLQRIGSKSLQTLKLPLNFYTVSFSLLAVEGALETVGFAALASFSYSTLLWASNR